MVSSLMTRSYFFTPDASAAYKSLCAGIIDPVLTLPINTPTTSKVVSPSTTSSRTVVTAVSSQPDLTQTTSKTDASAAAPTSTSNLPNGFTRNSSSKLNIQKTFVVAIGAVIGAALVL